MTPPVTPNDNQEKEPTSKPKSYRDAIGKNEKLTATNNDASTAATATATTTTASASSTATATGGKSKKANKQQQKAAKANASTNNNNNNNRSTRGHPQDATDYYDDSWYYGTSEEGYLSTGYTDDQEVFVGQLSAQVTENEVNQFIRKSSMYSSMNDVFYLDSRIISTLWRFITYSYW